MKIILPEIDYIFECDKDKTCSIIIENQRLFYDIVRDLSNQLQGDDGVSVLSENNKVITIAKHVELISQFIPFDINQKSLITKITSRLQALSVDETHHMMTNQIVAEWERYLMTLSMNLVGNLEFSKISAESLIKAAGVQIDNLYDNLGEQLLDYMELVREYDTRKLFIFINLRSYMSDDEMRFFLDSALERELQILLIDGFEHELLSQEERYIVDADKCIMC